MGSAMPPMLNVRAAPQPQPARWADEESCSICFNPTVGNAPLVDCQAAKITSMRAPGGALRAVKELSLIHI
eukprot:6181955-Pyramimonas_sp.AAC.1